MGGLISSAKGRILQQDESLHINVHLKNREGQKIKKSGNLKTTNTHTPFSTSFLTLPHTYDIYWYLYVVRSGNIHLFYTSLLSYRQKVGVFLFFFNFFSKFFSSLKKDGTKPLFVIRLCLAAGAPSPQERSVRSSPSKLLLRSFAVRLLLSLARRRRCCQTKRSLKSRVHFSISTFRLGFCGGHKLSYDTKMWWVHRHENRK